MAHIDFRQVLSIQQAIADPLRIRILCLLIERELCVCEIIDALGEPQYKVSRHLGILKKSGLLHDWREGTWIHYELDPELAPEWQEALEQLFRIWKKLPEVRDALERLQKILKRSPKVPCAKLLEGKPQ